MSSCLILYQNDKLYMSADTSACAKVGNDLIRVANDARKIKIIDDKIVFTSGNFLLCNKCFEYLESITDKEDFSYLLSNYLKRSLNKNDKYELEVMIGFIKNNKIEIDQISSYNNYDVIKHYGNNLGVGVLTSGTHNKELSKYVYKNFNSNIIDLYKKAYQSINDEFVGGDMLLYYLDVYNKKPKLIKQYTIDSYINYKIINPIDIHYILADSVVGQILIGEQLKLYSNDASAEMEFSDKGLILNAKKDDNGQYKRIFDIQKDGESQLWMDSEGNLVLAQDQFIDMIEKLDRMNVKYLDADKLYANNGTILNFGANFAEIQDLSAPKGTITALTSDTIEAVSGHFTGNVKVDTKLLAAAAQLDALTSTSGNIGELESFNATLENLNATIATITTLNVDEITAKKLNATAIKFTELEAAKATIENLISEIGNIKNLTSTKAIIENLSVKGDGSQADIDTLISALGVFTKITGDLGVFKELQADIANLTEAIIPTLSSTNATIENLNAILATIPTLNSTTITTDKIIAKSAHIEELDAALGDFEEIKAQLANIQTIMAGNIGTGLLQTIHLTAENTVLSEAFIKDLVAANIAVSDLKAGAISTNKFQIQSDDGGIIINGSTQQFKDNNDKVRLQIGKDAEGNFNFIIFGEDGTTAIYDQNGITKNAVPDGLIVNDMVSDSANISGSKLDINSVVTEINGSTTTINSNKIWVDEDNQSLGASFTQMKQSVNRTIKSVTPYYAKSTSNTTAPTDGWSEITPSRIEGEYIWRKDLYIKTDSSTSFGEPYCITGDRGENGSTGTGIESITAEYAKSTSKTSAPTTGWSEITPEWEAGYYVWTRTKIVYNNPTSIEYTTPYCDSSWEAIDDLKIGTVNLIRNAKTMIYDGYGVVLASGLSIFTVDESTLNISSVSTTIQDRTIVFNNNEAKVENNVLILGKE